MNNKPNTDEILAELNKVLARLTGEERKAIKAEFRTSLPPKAEPPKPPEPPVPPTPEPKQETAKPPEIQTEHAQVTPSNVAPDQLLRMAVFYYPGGGELPEAFFANFADVLQKTTKKRYYIEKTIVREADFSSFSVKQAAAECASKNVDAVFLLTKEPFEVQPEKVFVRNATAEQVKKRFFYVDLAVEVMLAKKNR